MKGYDLDGVICPEYNWIEGETPQSILERTMHLRPIFQPIAPYAIITGRTNTEITLKWIEKYLDEQPTFIFINSDNLDPAVFKAKILREFTEIESFVESEFKQFSYLSMCRQRIIWVEELF